MIKWPQNFIDVELGEFEVSEQLDVPKFRKYGFQIWRNFLNNDEVGNLITMQDSAGMRPFHPVACDLDAQTELNAVSQSIRIKISQRFKSLLGEDIGLTGARFLVKHKGEQGAVPIHQDLGYHIGHFDQISLFCSLNGASAHNGGLIVVPGSHHLGYLGDAGSLEKFYPESAEVCPALEPGDCIIMHCALIHYSEENQLSQARKLFEILLCPEEQPWRIDNILPSESTSNVFGKLNPREYRLFKSGRIQRLNSIRNILDQK